MRLPYRLGRDFLSRLPFSVTQPMATVLPLSFSATHVLPHLGGLCLPQFQSMQMTLIPARRELYPTPARKAACFFSEHDAHQESRRISTGRKDSAEWAALLAETREDAWRARQYNKQVQARTEAGEKARQQQQQGPQKKATEPAAFTFFEILGFVLA